MRFIAADLINQSVDQRHFRKLEFFGEQALEVFPAVGAALGVLLEAAEAAAFGPEARVRRVDPEVGLRPCQNWAQQEKEEKQPRGEHSAYFSRRDIVGMAGCRALT